MCLHPRAPPLPAFLHYFLLNEKRQVEIVDATTLYLGRRLCYGGFHGVLLFTDALSFGRVHGWQSGP